MDWYLEAFRKYAVFSGRASRSAYWYFYLFHVLISWGLGFLDAVPFLSILYLLVAFIPGWAVFVRRLHDTGRSGWFGLLVFVPIIGWLILLIFLIQDSDSGANQYGPYPD